MFKLILMGMFCVLSASCALNARNDSIRKVCGSDFSDMDIIFSFKKKIKYVKDGSDDDVFEVRRKNCNYYVSWYKIPTKIDMKTMLIFDSAGDVINFEEFEY